MQCSFRTLVFIYVFGGLTFVPLVIASVIAFIYYTSPLKESLEANKEVNDEKASVKSDLASGDEIKDDDELEGVDAHKVGWLQVSREYDSSIGLIGPEKIPGNQRGKYIDKMRSLLDRQDTLGPNNSGFLKVKAAMFYAVLKHGNLFLYESEEQVDVKHVIVLQHFVTAIWPPYEDDNALFLKPNAICLSRKDVENGSTQPKAVEEPRQSTEMPHKRTPPEHSYFLFPTTNIEKEDWYFALLRAAKSTSGSQKFSGPTDPTVAAVPAHFDPGHMFSLIQTIHSSDAQLQTRWLNALIGRIFLATYQTKHLEEIFIKKITKKIARVNRPAFLSDIKVQKVVLGTQAPVFTQPRLKELSAAGEFAADVNVAYNGGFRIEIATVATLQLGSRFKPRQVSLSMAVTVKKLEGKLLLRIKKPPSNRLWLGFYETPVMDLTIEPIVSSRQITYTMVLRAIESRIREAIEESVVLPNMDDTAFLPTLGEFYRGGIWERKPDEPPSDPNDPASIGDVEGVEKQMEGEAKGDAISKEESAENSESADSVDNLAPKRKMKTTLRSPAKEPVKFASEQNLKGRIGRSQSFTSVASAPAIVATDLINVSGTSPSRDSPDWSAEAAARAMVQKSRLGDSPKVNPDVPSDVSRSRPLSIKSDTSLEENGEKISKDLEIPPLTLEDRSSSAPPTIESIDENASISRSSTELPVKRQSTISPEKEPLTSRVTQATGAAKDMLKSRLNTYLAKRQQSKLQKQILTNDRDLLVNSVKPRTRLPSESTSTLDLKNEDDDIDSGPLPFENKKSPIFPPVEFSGMSSTGYGPSAMMTIPSTMLNARPPSSEADKGVTPSASPALPPRRPSMTASSSSPALPPRPASITGTSSPALPPRSPSIRRPVPTPPTPSRSAPRPIPRRPVPPIPPVSHSEDSAPPTTSSSPDEPKLSRVTENNDDDEDLMILHIPSDDEEELESGASSVKETAEPIVESPPERRKVEPEEAAVLEPSSYGSGSRSRRASSAKETVLPQWSEKQTADREMPELMEQGLMG